MMPRRVLLYALLIAVSGCNVFGPDGRCGPESREVLMTITPIALVEYGQLTVVERKASPARTLSWLLHSGELRGRIERATLVERGTGDFLMALPVTPGLDNIALQGSAVAYSGGVSFSRFFDLAREERIVLKLETTVLAQPLLQLPLTLYQHKPWSQPFCS